MSRETKTSGALSRVRAAGINIFFGYAGTVITALLSFVLRKIFILHLDETLLGVNGLYTGILSMLSMAELGVGTAFQFALYRPVAGRDIETVKSYMSMYARVYRAVAAAVALLGLALAPFLPVLIKNPGDHSVRDLTLYYFIFLFNTVSTYFVSYKYALANAEQRGYIQTNVITLTKLATVLLQILVLILTENFYAFLFTDAAVQLLQKIFVSIYLDHRYPYLRDRDIKALTPQARSEVWTKTRSLLMHRIGDAMRLQTDSLLISAFIEVAVVGMVDNYLLVVNTIANFVNIIFNSVISGFGNLIATEEQEKQQAMFRVYRFFAAYAYGFSFVGFYALLTPLISFLFGPGWMLPSLAVQLLLTDYYFKGERIVLSNYKTAAGVFEPDRYLALLQGIVNLVLSVVFVKLLGLAGIYIGTVVSGLIANLTKPFIIYRACFGEAFPKRYYLDNLKYLAVAVAALVPSLLLRDVLMPGAMEGASVSFPMLILTALAITAIFHTLFLLCFGRTAEARYLMDLLRERLHR